MSDDRPRSESADTQEKLREEIDNPIERLRLLSGDDDEISKYLDALEVTSLREREMMQEIARTQPLARPERFPEAHRNVVEALESLARHGYHGASSRSRIGPLRAVVRWGVELVARFVVVSHISDLSTQIRKLYVLREIQALPGSIERYELRRARLDAERMVDALKTKELGVPAFLVGGVALPLFASLSSVTGLLKSPVWATVIGVAGIVVALVASWVLLRGAALASRRIRLATRGPLRTLWNAIGWCGEPPEDSTRTFVIVSVSLTIACWLLIPVLVAIALAT